MLFCAATGNAGKLAELRRILIAQGHEVKSQKELGITIDPDETGTTFAENALIKAQTICAACGLPSILMHNTIWLLPHLLSTPKPGRRSVKPYSSSSCPIVRSYSFTITRIIPPARSPQCLIRPHPPSVSSFSAQEKCWHNYSTRRTLTDDPSL